MPVKLSTSAENVDIAAAELQPMLHNLQANILRPHGRDFARHVLVRFTADAAKVKAWIRLLTVERALDGGRRMLRLEKPVN